jgi:amino acid transporter
MLAPWAFVGFEVISLETAHFDFKMGRSRWIIIAAILLSGLVYVALTLVGVCSQPDGYGSWQAYIADLANLDGVSAVPTFHSARAIMGTGGLLVMAVAALAAILTGMIAAYRATARVLSTMAEANILSERFSKTTYSILFVMVISIVISIFGRSMLQCFMELTSLGAIIGFGYTSASAMRIARKNGDRRYVVLGAVGAAVSVAFVLVQLIPGFTALETMSADAFLMLMLWCLLGFIFYLKTAAHTKKAGTSLAGLVMFSLLMYSALLWLGKRLMAAESLDAVHSILHLQGPIMLLVIFLGLIATMFLQKAGQGKKQKGKNQGEKKTDLSG